MIHSKDEQVFFAEHDQYENEIMWFHYYSDNYSFRIQMM